jgi:cytochrome bd-type quinol oxidase subunit 1
MNIGPNHWIFAGVFAAVFAVGIIFAYRQDTAKNPELFKGASKFLLGVILIVMILVVVKILARLSS